MEGQNVGSLPGSLPGSLLGPLLGSPLGPLLGPLLGSPLGPLPEAPGRRRGLAQRGHYRGPFDPTLLAGSGRR